MDASVTRRGAIRIAERPGRRRAPVAVVAVTGPEAAAVAAALGALLTGASLAPATLRAYLAAPDAPARVILCAARGPAPRALAFLRRAAARLLWPAPAGDLLDAIGGLISSAVFAPRRYGGRAPAFSAARGGLGGRSALLLEGPVDPARARAALASAPRDWIVESVRHVRVGDRGLAALARAGVAWSALEPVELVAVYAAPPIARALGRPAWLPPGTAVWVRAGRGPRKPGTPPPR